MPIVAPKFTVPPLHPQTIQRTHLIEQLQYGLRLGHRLSLLAAPAGAGKSTLVAAWARVSDRPFAWLTLDAGDNDPAGFLADLGAALRQAPPGTAGAAADLTGWPAQIEALAASGPLVLVLDDLHRVEHPEVHALIAQLLDATPCAIHLVLITRVDPPLPLARMRAGTLLTELRLPDLSFSRAEIATWYSQMHGVELAPAQIAALDLHTAGWAAGLQLAAYALRACPSLAECLRRFDGSHYLVVEYLTSEVFQHLPNDLRVFLGQTAMLGKLSAPLCAAVTENPHSAELLARLVRANLFLTPLDNRHSWFRFHPLFAEAACAALAQPGQAERHRRAATWYAQHGFRAEAVAHALAAGDQALAARLGSAPETGAGPELLPTGPAEALPAPPSIPHDAPALIEPISEREQEVLGLLAAGLTYAEIAARLVVSVNTVRSHVKHLYGKLGAHVRTQALSRARALQLLR